MVVRPDRGRDLKRPLVLAHRGDTRAAVENTLPAFEAALAAGADGVELDVRTCASGEVVVIHNPHLFRLTGEGVDVARLSLAELRARDLGRGASAPTLDEALDLVLGAGKIVNVEVKSDVPDRIATARAVLRAIRRRSGDDREHIWLSTFDPLVAALLRAGRAARLGFLYDEHYTGARRGELTARALRAHAIHPHHTLVTLALVTGAHRRGQRVHVWTVNDRARARALTRLGVDALITDGLFRFAEPALDS